MLNSKYVDSVLSMGYEWTVQIQNVLQVRCIYAENLTIMFIYLPLICRFCDS